MKRFLSGVGIRERRSVWTLHTKLKIIDTNLLLLHDSALDVQKIENVPK